MCRHARLLLYVGFRHEDWGWGYPSAGTVKYIVCSSKNEVHVHEASCRMGCKDHTIAVAHMHAEQSCHCMRRAMRLLHLEAESNGCSSRCTFRCN